MTTLSHDPDQFLTLRDLTEAPTAQTSPLRRLVPRAYGPFSSKSAFLLAEWYWNSTNKSFHDFQQLVGIFKEPDFSISDTVNVDWKVAFRELSASRDDMPSDNGSWIQDDGWMSTPVSIEVPFHQRMSNPGIGRFVAGNLRHRSIVSVIKEKISNREDNRQFHYHPYQSTWKPTEESPQIQLYGEMYASQAFQDAHEELQRQPSVEEDGEDTERVVVALMLSSDGTHLNTFGSATLWPCYLFFGNESKYRRCRPTERLCHQIAYFEKV